MRLSPTLRYRCEIRLTAVWKRLDQRIFATIQAIEIKSAGYGLESCGIAARPHCITAWHFLQSVSRNCCARLLACVARENRNCRSRLKMLFVFACDRGFGITVALVFQSVPPTAKRT
jgi:hypothetical protein